MSKNVVINLLFEIKSLGKTVAADDGGSSIAGHNWGANAITPHTITVGMGGRSGIGRVAIAISGRSNVSLGV